MRVLKAYVPYKKPLYSGFTLVELLVVIAIIGIIASITLMSIDVMRNNAKDAAIKHQLQELVKVVQLDHLTTGNYSAAAIGWVGNTLCASKTITGPSATKLRQICQAIEDNINNKNATVNGYMHWGVHPTFGSADHFSFMVRLNAGRWFCVGSSGKIYEGASSNPPGGPLAPGYTSWGGPGCYANP